MYPENKHHIFVELAERKVRDAKMLTLDEIAADGWEPDARRRITNLSSHGFATLTPARSFATNSATCGG